MRQDGASRSAPAGAPHAAAAAAGQAANPRITRISEGPARQECRRDAWERRAPARHSYSQKEQARRLRYKTGARILLRPRDRLS